MVTIVYTWPLHIASKIISGYYVRPLYVAKWLLGSNMQ